MPNSVYSVTQVNTYIKNMFETDYLLKSLEVKGEISNLKYHSSGHIYFTLKDETSAIRCVFFRGYASSLNFVLKEGMKVTVKCSCNVYERDGSYQLYVTGVKQEGKGDLFLEFERLKEKLSDLGMFDEMYKRPIPKFVKTLGVVTAETGAAVQDIIRVSTNRNPGIQIVLFPATVQGPEAPASIIAGIKALERYGVDVIIAGRGGGSIEDLWGFNDEGVAQAIFDCNVPVISAVGHETDFTIADFVADRRAATPSNAAEIAVCDVSVYTDRISDLREDVERLMLGHLDLRRDRCDRLKREVSLLSPMAKVSDKKNRLESASKGLKDLMDWHLSERKSEIDPLLSRLDVLMTRRLTEAKHRLEVNAGRLSALSPLNKLAGGFSYVTHEGRPLKSVNAVKPGDELSIALTDGYISAKTESVTPIERKRDQE